MTTEREIAAALLEWASSFGRRAPWREGCSPYALAVAEVLLQKTKGHDAEPVWRELISRFPTAAALAAAPDHDVRQIVASLGLGNQRTARLKALAGALSTYPLPKKLPALGPYGSAVTALAAGKAPDTAPVDGNVARVITRVYGLTFPRGEPRKKPEVKAAVSNLLATQERPDSQLAVAYALVDLGAGVCTPARPDCPACPIRLCCLTASAPLSAGS